MSLRYIFGEPGTGKTNLCIDELISCKDREPTSNLIYIVPEQFSLQSEKALINRVDTKALMQIQILSFQRLAYHVLNEVGNTEKNFLEDIGKNMLIRKVVSELKQELNFYSRVIDKQGFIEQVFDALVEFSQYDIGVEKLEEIISKIENNETLKLKMTDLHKILKKYKSFQLENYILNEEKLDILAHNIEKSDMIKNSVIWIDGFNGFTPQEYKIIEKLLLISKRVNITLSIDSKLIFNSSVGKSDYFFGIRSTVKSINEIVITNNIPDEEIVCLNQNYRLKDNPEILHLQQNYLLSHQKQYKQDVKNIRIISSDNLYQEIENIASIIMSLVMKRGYKFNEIAIIAPYSDEYSKNINLIFQKHNIPVFIDMRVDIMSHPLIELVRSTLSIITENFSYESMFRFLKTNLTPINQKDVDIMENYALLYGIRGAKWKKTWEYGFDGNYEMFDYENINELRTQIITTLSTMTERYKSHKKYNVKEISETLFLFLESIDVTKIIEAWAEQQMQNGNIELSSQQKQVWSKFVNVLEKMVEILGDEEVTIEEYSKIIDAGFSKSHLSSIPPSLDQVIVGNLQHSRMPDIKALFILGVNEGVLPSNFKESGLLNDDERIYLGEKQSINLMPNSIMKSYEEKFLVYTMISKPSELIYFSYYLGNLDGKSNMPSSIIKNIKYMFPKVKEYRLDASKQFISSRFAYNSFIMSLDSFAEKGEVDDFYKDIYSLLFKDDKYKEKIENITRGFLGADSEKILGEDTIKKIYNNTINASVSRIEKYIQCPFAYFAQYNLKASERKVYEMASVDLGNLFHDALDGFASKLQEENINWRDADDAIIYNIASESIDKTLFKDTNEIFRNTKQYEHFASRAKRIAMHSISVIIEHMRSGEFDFTFSEASFDNSEDSLGAIDIRINDDVIMHLEGRIDRVDMLSVDSEQYVKIIDYKSGKKTFSFPEIFYGLQLQLVIYLDAFIKKYKDKYVQGNTEVLPAAILYFRIDNPLVNFNDISQKDDIQSALYKQFKMSGVVVNEIDIIQKIDENFEPKSDIIPVGIKSSGAFKKLPLNERPLTENSSAISNEEFGKLMQFSIDKVTQTGKDILTGEISAKPFKYGNMTGCTYCAYKPICKFDSVHDSSNYNIMSNMSSKKAKEKIIKDIDK